MRSAFFNKTPLQLSGAAPAAPVESIVAQVPFSLAANQLPNRSLRFPSSRKHLWDRTALGRIEVIELKDNLPVFSIPSDFHKRLGSEAAAVATVTCSHGKSLHISLQASAPSCEPAQGALVVPVSFIGASSHDHLSLLLRSLQHGLDRRGAAHLTTSLALALALHSGGPGELETGRTGVPLTLTATLLLPAVALTLTPLYAKRLCDVPLVQTLSQQQGPGAVVQTGYLSMDQARSLLPLAADDPNVYSVPLVGVWVRGVRGTEHPLVFGAALQFAYTSSLPDRAVQPDGAFLLLIFTGEGPVPRCYEARFTDPAAPAQLRSAAQDVRGGLLSPSGAPGASGGSVVDGACSNGGLRVLPYTVRAELAGQTVAPLEFKPVLDSVAAAAAGPRLTLPSCDRPLGQKPQHQPHAGAVSVDAMTPRAGLRGLGVSARPAAMAGSAQKYELYGMYHQLRGSGCKLMTSPSKAMKILAEEGGTASDGFGSVVIDGGSSGSSHVAWSCGLGTSAVVASAASVATAFSAPAQGWGTGALHGASGPATGTPWAGAGPGGFPGAGAQRDSPPLPRSSAVPTPFRTAPGTFSDAAHAAGGADPWATATGGGGGGAAVPPCDPRLQHRAGANEATFATPAGGDRSAWTSLSVQIAAAEAPQGAAQAASREAAADGDLPVLPAVRVSAAPVYGAAAPPNKAGGFADWMDQANGVMGTPAAALAKCEAQLHAATPGLTHRPIGHNSQQQQQQQPLTRRACLAAGPAGWAVPGMPAGGLYRFAGPAGQPWACAPAVTAAVVPDLTAAHQQARTSPSSAYSQGEQAGGASMRQGAADSRARTPWEGLGSSGSGTWRAQGAPEATFDQSLNVWLRGPWSVCSAATVQQSAVSGEAPSAARQTSAYASAAAGGERPVAGGRSFGFRSHTAAGTPRDVPAVAAHNEGAVGAPQPPVPSRPSSADVHHHHHRRHLHPQPRQGRSPPAEQNQQQQEPQEQQQLPWLLPQAQDARQHEERGGLPGELERQRQPQEPGDGSDEAVYPSHDGLRGHQGPCGPDASAPRQPQAQCRIEPDQALLQRPQQRQQHELEFRQNLSQPQPPEQLQIQQQQEGVSRQIGVLGDAAARTELEDLAGQEDLLPDDRVLLKREVLRLRRQVADLQDQLRSFTAGTDRLPLGSSSGGNGQERSAAPAASVGATCRLAAAAVASTVTWELRGTEWLTGPVTDPQRRPHTTPAAADNEGEPGGHRPWQPRQAWHQQQMERGHLSTAAAGTRGGVPAVGSDQPLSLPSAAPATAGAPHPCASAAPAGGAAAWRRPLNGHEVSCAATFAAASAASGGSASQQPAAAVAVSLSAAAAAGSVCTATGAGSDRYGRVSELMDTTSASDRTSVWSMASLRSSIVSSLSCRSRDTSRLNGSIDGSSSGGGSAAGGFGGNMRGPDCAGAMGDVWVKEPALDDSARRGAGTVSCGGGSNGSRSSRNDEAAGRGSCELELPTAYSASPADQPHLQEPSLSHMAGPGAWGWGADGDRREAAVRRPSPLSQAGPAIGARCAPCGPHAERAKPWERAAAKVLSSRGRRRARQSSSDSDSDRSLELEPDDGPGPEAAARPSTPPPRAVTSLAAGDGPPASARFHGWTGGMPPGTAGSSATASSFDGPGQLLRQAAISSRAPVPSPVKACGGGAAAGSSSAGSSGGGWAAAAGPVVCTQYVPLDDDSNGSDSESELLLMQKYGIQAL